MIKSSQRLKRFLMEKLPLSRALIMIFLSVLAVSGTASLAVLYYWKVVWSRAADPDYQITEIVHEVIEGEHLPSRYLQEQLSLSQDHPISYYRFDSKEASRRLAVHGILENVDVRCRFPNRMIVRYRMRQPIAFIAELPNTALDSHGVLFPYEPFFYSADLPYIRLGKKLNQVEGGFWGRILGLQEVELGLTLMELLNQEAYSHLKVKEIDLSEAFSESAGKRQIALTVLESPMPQTESLRILRLSSVNYETDLLRYLKLNEELIKTGRLNELLTGVDCLVIDLRLPHLAYLQKHHTNL